MAIEVMVCRRRRVFGVGFRCQVSVLASVSAVVSPRHTRAAHVGCRGFATTAITGVVRTATVIGVIGRLSQVPVD